MDNKEQIINEYLIGVTVVKYRRDKALPVSAAHLCSTVLVIGNTVVKYHRDKALPISDALFCFSSLLPASTSECLSLKGWHYYSNRYFFYPLKTLKGWHYPAKPTNNYNT